MKTRTRIGAAATTVVVAAALAGNGAAQALPDDTTTTTSSTTSSSTTTSSTSSTSTAPDTTGPAACSVLHADVEGGTATFTIGPPDCAGQVGPISFSTYFLPGGWRQPYEAQILIAHAAGNGSSYGAGTHTLTAPIGDACNWQSDLYRAPSDDQPPLVRLLGYDYVEGRTCDTTTTSSTAPTTTVATSSTSEVRSTTTTSTTVPAAATSSSTTLLGNAGGSTTTTSIVAAGPPTTMVAGASPGIRVTTTTATTEPAVSPRTGSLPSTGPSLVLGILAIGLGAVVLGALMRRVAGSPRT